MVPPNAGKSSQNTTKSVASVTSLSRRDAGGAESDIITSEHWEQVKSKKENKKGK